MKYWEIGPSIKALRKGKGLRQSELAAAVGLSRVTLSKLENGKLAGISIGALLSILERLGREIAFVEPSALPTLEELAAEKDAGE
ncbi:MAG: helix-turn-helix domain-containing protein [Spirochaetales bacterium]